MAEQTGLQRYQALKKQAKELGIATKGLKLAQLEKAILKASPKSTPKVTKGRTRNTSGKLSGKSRYRWIF